MFTRSKITGVVGGKIRTEHRPIANSAFSTRGRQYEENQKQLTASLGGFSGSGGGNSMSINSYWSSQLQYMFTGLIPAEPSYSDMSQLALFYRDIYLNDSTAGSCVDIQSSFPFSDFDLRGLEEDQLDVYKEALSQLNILQMLPYISTAYLVDGFFCGSLVFDQKTKRFIDTMVHDALQCQIIHGPFFNMMPTINIQTSAATTALFNSNSSYTQEYLRSLPHAFLQMLQQGSFTLNPVNTLFIARRSLTDRAYVSFLHRILPMYLIEKTMFRGTLVEASRRQRATTHLTAGDDTWTPTGEELQALVSEFQQAEFDPLGGWVSTRGSVQVNDIRCLGGSNLINTSKGLIKIKDLVTHDYRTMIPGTSVAVDLLVKNHTGQCVPVKHWWYQGVKPTFDLLLEDGTQINATENHKFVTVGDLARRTLIKTSELTSDTWLLKPINEEVRTERLKLDLEWPDVETRPSNAGFTLPEYMTPELAYCLALIISEGTIYKGYVTVTNSDGRILKQYAKFMRSLFGIDYKVSKRQRNEPETILIRGVSEANFVKNTAAVSFSSMHLVDVLKQLGLQQSRNLRTYRSPSYRKTTPAAILQADHQSQLGFIAGYLDGDGSVKLNTELTFKSTSKQIMRSMHSMLTDMSICSKLTIGKVLKGAKYGTVSEVNLSLGQASILAPKLTLCKKLIDLDISRSRTHGLGIPAEVIVETLVARDVSVRNQCRNVKGTKIRGSLFLDDDGLEVFVAGGWKALFKPFVYASTARYESSRSFFSYANYDAGAYNEHMALIKKVSASLYHNVTQLFKNRYLFCKVHSVTAGKEQPVYDLTMEESNAPVFVVNGVLSKNSAGEFWKWTDMADILVPYKLRALGISESFLSGDASYASAESAVSSFMETQDSYRTHLTNSVFYTTLFPLIAVANGFYKKDTPAEKRVQHGNVSQFLMHAHNRSSLATPTLVWHKSLEAKGEENTFELLQQASEKGVPIPLKAWMAAAGLDVDTLMKDLKEDTELRAKLEQYTGKDTSHEGEEQIADEDTENPHLASFRPTSQSFAAGAVGRRSLLSRQFNDHDVFDVSKTGQKKHVVNNPRGKQKDQNWMIAKIANRAQYDSEYRWNLAKANVARYGTATIAGANELRMRT